jgi:outer membrane immunogenic protein
VIRTSRLLPFLLLVMGPACAQEISTPSAGGVTADFSGVGLGVDAGVGLGSAGQVNESGIIGGLHVGYNFQAARLVGGAEADVLGSNINSGSSPSLSFKQSFLSSARVKAGYVFADLLAYGTVGWAYSTTSLHDLSGSSNRTIDGAVFGAGVEYALTRSVFIRGEYLRYNFGSKAYMTPLSATPVSTATNLLRGGISVHF